MNVIISNRYQVLLSNLDIDVIKSMQGEFDVEELISTFANFFFNKMIIDITAIKDYQNLSVMQHLSVGMDMSKVILLLDDSPVVNSPMYLSELVSMGIYNFSRNIDSIKFLIDNPNSYKDVAMYHKIKSMDMNGTPSNVQNGSDGGFGFTNYARKVIGFKDVTEGAGATTLIYMLKKQLSVKHSVSAVEVNANDFRYFNDSDLMSVSDSEFPRFVTTSDSEILLVDLNDSANMSVCDEVIYLIEPTTIKLNKMIRTDRDIFTRLSERKIVLNRSLLNDKDVKDFEYESRASIFFNIPYLDDKMDSHSVLDRFMTALNIGIDSNDDKGGKLFGIKKVN